MTILLMVLAFSTVVALCHGFWLFDCLVRWEYEHHHDQWVADGKPSGFFWSPTEGTNMLTQQWRGLVWMLKAPDWVRASPRTRRWLLQIRIITVTVNVVVVFFAYLTPWYMKGGH